MSRPVKSWSAQDDKELMEGIANGMAIEASGKLLNRSKGASIGRFNRLKQDMGWQVA